MKNLTILAYHRVFPEPRGVLAVTPELFEQQLRSFLKKGYTAYTLCDVHKKFIKKGKKVPRKTLVITFDDGYKDNYVYAFPILQRLKLPATIFLTAEYIGTARTFPWDETDPDLTGTSLGEMDHPLTWEQVREMAQKGIEFGSHTMTHPKLTRIDIHDAQKEMVRSKQRIEKELGKPVHSFCAPHGYLNGALVELTKSSGYALGVLNPPGITGQDKDLPETIYSLRRIGVYAADSVRKLHLKNSFLFMSLYRTARAFLKKKHPVQ